MIRLHLDLIRAVFPIVVGSALLLASRADAQDAPHYTLVKIFGVDMERSEDRGYPVSAYLPPRTLLFDIDHTAPDLTVGQLYSYAVTQDGVPIAIYNPPDQPAISRGPLLCDEIAPFPNCDADLLVFHTSYDLCRDMSCIGDGARLSINPGDIAEIVDTNDDFVELTINRGELVAAVISREELATAEHRAIVTRVNISDPDLRHPHFRVEVTRSELVSADCGEIATSPPQLVAVSQVEETIIEALRLGIVDRSTATEEGLGKVVFNQFGREADASGNGAERWEHRFYRFANQRQNAPDRTFAAQIVYRCIKTGSISESKYIRFVNLVEIADDEVVDSITLMPWMQTPDGISPDEYRFHLRSQTRDPFLWSVNTPEQHFSLMKQIVAEFGNRAMAGYFYSEFNRSCNSEGRLTVLCRGYDFGREGSG